MIPEDIHDEKYEKPYEKGRLAAIQELIPETSHNSALDLGAGGGVISSLLTHRGWSVTAIDLNPYNVMRAAPRVARAMVGDAVSVCRSLQPAVFDFIVALELIEHLDDAGRSNLLREMRQLAAPSSRLLISTPNRMSPDGLYGYYYSQLLRGHRYTAWDSNHAHIYSSFELLRELRAAGWKPVRIVGYHYAGKISLPLTVSHRWPLNRFGFQVIVLAGLARAAGLRRTRI